MHTLMDSVCCGQSRQVLYVPAGAACCPQEAAPAQASALRPQIMAVYHLTSVLVILIYIYMADCKFLRTRTCS